LYDESNLFVVRILSRVVGSNGKVISLFLWEESFPFSHTFASYVFFKSQHSDLDLKIKASCSSNSRVIGSTGEKNVFPGQFFAWDNRTIVIRFLSIEKAENRGHFFPANIIHNLSRSRASDIAECGFPAPYFRVF